MNRGAIRPQLVPDYQTNDGYTQAQAQVGPNDVTMRGVPTVLERNHHAAPPLRLITGGKVAETTVSVTTGSAKRFSTM